MQHGALHLNDDFGILYYVACFSFVTCLLSTRYAFVYIKKILKLIFSALYKYRKFQNFYIDPFESASVKLI